MVRNLIVKTEARAMKAKEGRELKFDIIGNKDLFKVSEWGRTRMIRAS